jgi:hypothetical protein
MDIDWEAIEGIFGFFQVAYKSMVYFANFQHSISHVFHTCTVSHHEYARVDGVIYSMDPIFSVGCHVSYTCIFRMRVIRRMTCSIQDEHVMGCDVATFCHTCAFHIMNMRGNDTLYSNGGCLRLDAIHAAVNAWVPFLLWTVMYVDAFVSAGTKGSMCSMIFCRYTNNIL